MNLTEFAIFDSKCESRHHKIQTSRTILYLKQIIIYDKWRPLKIKDNGQGSSINGVS